ncbi:MAG: glycoside hydrolase family 43 protein [Verrucomicrobia bacterium]|nr:glycoside hydrolase family 43 protein [Verrucomicrobiota bacterium]MCH8511771.1 glycoside hydrolase family 43 protein [Kiritimatiellia bacterium]
MNTLLRNPILPGFHPDPTLCRVGADFYLCTSTFEYFPGLPVYHSRDLQNWTLIGHGLHRPEQLDYRKTGCSEGIFAPTLRHHAGTFYLITTQVGGGGNFFITATDPAGPWSDPIWIQEEGAPWFDPSLFFDDDGKVYYTRRHAFSIVQAELDLQTGNLLTPPREIARPWCTDDIEGPHLYKQGGWYYLLTAEGGTGWGHCITVARSASPWGPFESCPHNPILTHRHLPNHPVRSTGHGDWVEDEDGNSWLVFLATRHHGYGGQAFHHLGRETFLTPLHWENGWPVVTEPILETGPPPPPFRDDFTTAELGSAWLARRQPDPAHVDLTSRPGTLRLPGAAATLDDNQPEAFRGVRLDRYDFSLRTQLEFSPRAENEEAGLALVMADDCHLEWVRTRRDRREVLLLRRRVLDLMGEEVCECPGDETLILCIRGNARQFTFLAGATEEDLQPLARADRRLFCTEVATGWTGLIAGVYASGNGKPAQTPADFHWVVLD